MKIVACFSNKGGVGKTATTVNLADALAASGKRTQLCNPDPQGASGYLFRAMPLKKLPFASEIERMGGHRALISATAPHSAPANSNGALFEDLMVRVEQA